MYRGNPLSNIDIPANTRRNPCKRLLVPAPRLLSLYDAGLPPIQSPRRNT